VLGAPVPLRLILARTDDVVVAILGAAAYPTGVELTLAIRRRTFDPYEHHLSDPFELHGRPGEPLPPDRLRFGVQFADGRKATTVDALGAFAAAPDATPEAPTLVPGHGSGGGGVWDMELWLWPLPPEGPIAFVCEWPSEGIELTRVEIDAEPILTAAALAEPLWP